MGVARRRDVDQLPPPQGRQLGPRLSAVVLSAADPGRTFTRAQRRYLSLKQTLLLIRLLIGNQRFIPAAAPESPDGIPPPDAGSATPPPGNGLASQAYFACLGTFICGSV